MDDFVFEMTIKQLADYTNHTEHSVRYYSRKYKWQPLGYRGKEKIYPSTVMEQLPNISREELEQREQRELEKKSKPPLDGEIKALTAKLSQLEASNQSLTEELNTLKTKLNAILPVIKKMGQWKATVDAKLGQ